MQTDAATIAPLLLAPLLALSLLAAPDAKPDTAADAGPRYSLLYPPKGPVPGIQFTIPGVVAEVEIPGRMEALGTPVRIRAVKSTEPLNTLMTHFLREFKRHGLYIPPREQLTGPPKSGYLVAYDVRTRIGYTVFFQKNDDGTITVIQGEGHVGERNPKKQGENFAPVFPGGHDLLHGKVEGARTLQYVAVERPEQVQAFYAETLAREGYTQLRSDQFQRGDTLLQVFIRPDGPSGSFVLLTEQTGTSPAPSP